MPFYYKGVTGVHEVTINTVYATLFIYPLLEDIIFYCDMFRLIRQYIYDQVQGFSSNATLFQ
jgi:hypothetical protein